MNPILIYMLQIFTTEISSYQILNPKEVEKVGDAFKSAPLILGATPLDPDMYRLGNTKA